MTLDGLQPLADALERDWRRANYDEDAFAELATATLRQAKPSADLSAISSWLLSSNGLTRAPFGPQPPRMVWAAAAGGRRFQLGAGLITGSSPIHQHAHSGALVVTEGSLRVTEYAFDVSETFGIDLQLGRLTATRITLAGPGDLVTVRAGRTFIHSTRAQGAVGFIGFRSLDDVRSLPVYEYLPGLALHRARVGQASETRARLYGLMTDVAHPLAGESLNTFLRSMPPLPLVALLLGSCPADEPAMTERVARALRERFGQSGDLIATAWQIDGRRRAMRRRIDGLSAEAKLLGELLLACNDPRLVEPVLTIAGGSAQAFIAKHAAALAAPSAPANSWQQTWSTLAAPLWS